MESRIEKERQIVSTREGYISATKEEIPNTKDNNLLDEFNEDIERWETEIKDAEETIELLNIVKDAVRNVDMTADDFIDVHLGETGRDLYFLLQDRLGSPKKASQFLDSVGIVGNMYLDGTSRNKGEGTYNFVIFNEKNAQIVRRLFQEGKDTVQKIRGSIGLPQQFGNNAPVQITITPNADFSTAVHELGHFFLWEQFNLAQLLPDDAQLQSDVQTIREWLGMGEEQAELTTEQHEKFARGFEAYLREGKAPSVELLSVFQRFKSWLCEVYKSLTELDVELSDDVRGVFDSLLATPQEMDEFYEANTTLEELLKETEAIDNRVSGSQARPWELWGVDDESMGAQGLGINEQRKTNDERRTTNDQVNERIKRVNEINRKLDEVEDRIAEAEEVKAA